MLVMHHDASRTPTYSDEQIARVCHEANRALQVVNADPGIEVSPPWDEAPESQRDSAIAGVHAHRANGGLTPVESHQLWCDHKLATGWTYGPVKDEARKEHPCLIPYEDLDPGDRVKDELFSSIVRALSGSGQVEPDVIKVQQVTPGSIITVRDIGGPMDGLVAYLGDEIRRICGHGDFVIVAVP